jgi:GNAT superfamily N-acetyltransferase
VVLLVEQETEVLAYGSLLWNSAYPPFRAASIPEVNDLVVAEGSRQRGVGTQLLRALEQTALPAGFTQIGVGVGLYDDYGPAQRLYVLLGYVPDGRGVTYRDAHVSGGATVQVDDELVLWVVKLLDTDSTTLTK